MPCHVYIDKISANSIIGLRFLFYMQIEESLSSLGTALGTNQIEIGQALQQEQ